MNRRLELIVFVSGGVSMVLELVGSRVLSPFFGNSMFVWTGLIGVILGSLSLGYYFGGKLADKKGNMNDLGKILLLASIFVLATAFFKEQILVLIASTFKNDIRVSSLLSIFILFAPASALLGCVSPYAAKIRIVSQKGVGSTMGNLYALSTLGSITGTFSAGYLLIPNIGNTNLLYLMAVILLFLAVLSVFRFATVHIVLLALFLFAFYLNTDLGFLRLNVLADIDSLYNRILVRKTLYKDRDAIVLSIENFGSQSLVYATASGELVSDYTNAYRIGGLINKNLDKALMLGGAGFTFPRYYLDNKLGNTIDVVEIDPTMVDVAKKYFFLKDDPRMNIYITDARLFFNETDKKYDVIYFDAFSSINPPYYLTTKEFFEKLKEHLTDNGIVMINMISSTTGRKSAFLNAEGNTLKNVFGKLDLFVIQQKSSNEVQNLMVVAYKGDRPEKITSDDKLLGKLTSERYNLENKITSKTLLTDDYAPVDYITSSLYDSRL